MNSEEIFEYFINSVFPPLVFLIGMIGNFIGLKVINGKKLKNIGPILIYKFLFITDSIYLPQILIVYMITGFNCDITILSSLGCKVYNYFNYALDSFSPWLLVYISVEKFISIIYPEKRFVLRQNLNQFLFLVGIIFFSLIYYIPQAFCWDVIDVGSTNETFMQCTYINYELQQVSSYMDVIHRFAIPFTLMIVFSSLLIGSIFKSRNQVANYTADNGKRLKRDIRFAVSSFSMNLLFMALNLPLSILELTPNFSLILFNTTLYLFYLSYGVNFYILLITNSIFRAELFEICGKKLNQNNNQQENLQKNATIMPNKTKHRRKNNIIKETISKITYKDQQVVIHTNFNHK